MKMLMRMNCHSLAIQLGSKVAAITDLENRGSRRRSRMAGDGMNRIKHVVVVMMENRSFDSLLGFLYADVNNRPPINIPAASPGGQTRFDGLVDAGPGSPFWKPSNPKCFTSHAPPMTGLVTE